MNHYIKKSRVGVWIIALCFYYGQAFQWLLPKVCPVMVQGIVIPKWDGLWAKNFG